MSSIVSVGEQALADDKNVAPYLCGLAFGEDALAPAGQEWFTLLVDEEICSGDIFFSMASMLGGLYRITRYILHLSLIHI